MEDTGAAGAPVEHAAVQGTRGRRALRRRVCGRRTNTAFGPAELSGRIVEDVSARPRKRHRGREQRRVAARAPAGAAPETPRTASTSSRTQASGRSAAAGTGQRPPGQHGPAARRGPGESSTRQLSGRDDAALHRRVLQQPARPARRSIQPSRRRTTAPTSRPGPVSSSLDGGVARRQVSPTSALTDRRDVVDLQDPGRRVVSQSVSPASRGRSSLFL